MRSALARYCSDVWNAFALLLLFHQEENRLDIHGADLVPRFGDFLGLPRRGRLSPIPSIARTIRNADRARRRVHTAFRGKGNTAPRRTFGLPAERLFAAPQHFVRQLSQHARHVQIERGRFRAVGREPSFAHRLLAELVPRGAGLTRSCRDLRLPPCRARTACKK